SPEEVWSWLRNQFADGERRDWPEWLEKERGRRRAESAAPESTGPSGSSRMRVVDVAEGGRRGYRVSYAVCERSGGTYRARPGPIGAEVAESEVAAHIVEVAHGAGHFRPRHDGEWNRIRVVLPKRLLYAGVNVVAHEFLR